MKPYFSCFPSLRSVGAGAVLLLAGLSVRAQVDPYPTIPPNPPIPSLPAEPLPTNGFKNTDGMLPDRQAERFITKVSMLQSEEARLSVIATQRALHEKVREFAKQVRASNLNREQELAQLAQQRSVTLPTGRDAKDAAEDNERWQSKDSADFDDDYVRRIVKIQQNAVDTLEECAQGHNSDPELAAYAQKHLPEVRESLRQAQSLKQSE